MTLKPLNDKERESLEQIISLLTRKGQNQAAGSQDKAGQANRQLKNATRSI
ncbi:MAG: hypothetical protein AB1916_08740 [Thermodesulfobacteriota bacterium]